MALARAEWLYSGTRGSTVEAPTKASVTSLPMLCVMTKAEPGCRAANPDTSYTPPPMMVSFSS